MTKSSKLRGGYFQTCHQGVDHPLLVGGSCLALCCLEKAPQFVVGVGRW